MLVELYLKMFRSDLAEKQLKVMKGIDEDAVLTMLATAQVNLAPVWHFVHVILYRSSLKY